MKGLILAATLSAAVGFTYSALSAEPLNPPQPDDDPNCYKNCGNRNIIGRATRSCNEGPSACSVTWCSHAAGALICGYPDSFVDRCSGAGEFYLCRGDTVIAEGGGCKSYCAPYYEMEGGACDTATDYCSYEWGCGYGFTDGGSGCCCDPTPILVDISGDGFRLTDAYTGVHFDLGGDGRAEPVAWTAAGSDDA